MESSRWKWIVGLACLAVGLGFLLKLRETGDDLHFALQPKQTFFYKVSYIVKGETTINPLTAEPLQVSSKSHIQVEASLALRLEEKSREGQFEFSFRFVPSIWQVQIPVQQFAPKIPQSIEGRIVMTDRGQIIRFGLRQEQVDALSPWMADIFSLMSVTLPSGSDTWQSSEESFQSRGEVAWRLLSQREGQQVRLQRSYVESKDQSPSLSGQGIVALSLVDYLDVLDLKRERRYMQNFQVHAKDETVFKLERTADLEMPGVYEPKVLVDDDLSGSRYEKQQERIAAQRTLGLSSYSDVQMELDAIDQSQMKNSIPVYQKLKALFLLHPEKINQFRDFVLQYPYSDLRCAHVLTAATAVGSSEAQEFLRSLFPDLRDQPGMQRQIIPHLSMVESPNEASESFMRELTRHPIPEIRSTAQLGLGTIAHQLIDQDPVRSLNILHEQTARLNSVDSKEKVNALRSIGNIGLPQQFEIVEPFVNDPDTEVRGVAVDALRHVNTSEARARLFQILEEEADAAIRLTAAESLNNSHGSEGDLQRLKLLLYREKEIPVLKQIISKIALMAGEFRTARDLLEIFAAQCGHPELCGFVESTLQSISIGQ